MDVVMVCGTLAGLAVEILLLAGLIVALVERKEVHCGATPKSAKIEK